MLTYINLYLLSECDSGCTHMECQTRRLLFRNGDLTRHEHTDT